MRSTQKKRSMGRSEAGTILRPEGIWVPISTSRSAPLEADRDNHLPEELTTMSFLSFHEGRPLFVVQTGIVAWEDKQPIVDWRWKTVSILSRELHAAAALLWALVSS